MNNLWRKSFMAGILSVSLTAGAVTPAFASAAPDGKTDAASLAGGMGISRNWESWKAEYITFAFSFSFVVLLFLNHVENMEKIMFIAFIVGNILYYIVGIILAFLFKDNRAFCKYICPVTIFLKPMSYFSVVRVKCDKEKCISCGKCKKVCPMNVDITDNSRKRKNGTECILCMECVKACLRKAL